MSSTELRGGGRRLTVDHSLCSGTGHCRDLMPEIFRVQRLAWLAEDADLAAADPGRLAEAEISCPWFAITFEQGDGQQLTAPHAP